MVNWNIISQEKCYFLSTPSTGGPGSAPDCAGTNGITCGRKSRGDEKQLIDLEWPKESDEIVTVFSKMF